MKYFTLLILIALFSDISFAQPVKIYNAAELQIQINKLDVVGSVLYLAAHPDDENTALLSFFSQDKLLNTAYLSLTRGGGGQNLIGSEKGSLIGMIRTQELLEARKIDGGHQFFTRAVDFGYSKSFEESLSKWNRDSLLSDIVWVIRKFKPDIIVTRFPPSKIKTHGHHLVSGILALQAFKISGDKSYFPNQLKYVDVWQPKRIFWDSWRAKEKSDSVVTSNVGKLNRYLGKSYTEIAALSRSKHKSQGFGAKGRRGVVIDYLKLTGGQGFKNNDPFDGIDLTWNRVENSGEIQKLISDIKKGFSIKNPQQSVKSLLNLYDLLKGRTDDYWIRQKLKEVNLLIQSCMGLWLEAISDDYSYSKEDLLNVKFNLVNNFTIPINLNSITTPFGNKVIFNKIIEPQAQFNESQTIRIPKNTKNSISYWLESEPVNSLDVVKNQTKIGLPENKPQLQFSFEVEVLGKKIVFNTAALYRQIDRVRGELYRDVEIRPSVFINFENGIKIFSPATTQEIQLRIKSNTNNFIGDLSFPKLDGWKITPSSTKIDLKKKYEELVVSLKITSPASEGVFILNPIVSRAEEVFNRSLVEIKHNHIKVISHYPNAELKLVNVNVNKTISNIGYIEGSGDDIPKVLTQLGYNVEFIDDDILDNNNLDKYDVIICGVRAFNTRRRLASSSEKIKNYIQNGGTFFVQYNVSFGLVTNNIGPYPFTIGRERVTDESATITIRDPDSPFLTTPNKIYPADFENWVQERGLYFASEWDENYNTLFKMNDSGESAKLGSLIYCKFGEGYFIYSGISWFRQLPAGVPGAIKLFNNIISIGK